MQKIWKQIPGWAKYEVSSFGDVRNAKSGRNLRQQTDKDGYKRVTLCSPARIWKCFVHGLVANAFVGVRPIGMQVRHIDGSRDNNTPANLVYGTAKDNADDRTSHGNTPNGDKHPRTKASDASVLHALELAKSIGLYKAAESIGISGPALSMIRSGGYRKHLNLKGAI